MIKFLLIIFISFFVLSKIIGFLLRTFFGSVAQQYQQRTGRKPADGSVHIDYDPKGKEKNGKNFKGGEYVDFEEIKE